MSRTTFDERKLSTFLESSYEAVVKLSHTTFGSSVVFKSQEEVIYQMRQTFYGPTFNGAEQKLICGLEAKVEFLQIGSLRRACAQRCLRQ